MSTESPSSFKTTAITAALAAAGCLALAAPAAADDLNVTTTADAGVGSLRQALILANADLDHDRLVVTASGEIPLLSPLPTIKEPLTIDGPGARTLTVRRGGAAPSMRVFEVDEGVPVTIEGLTVANGYSNYGANIASEGDLTLDGVVVKDGFAESGQNSEAYGGGIYNHGNGRMTIRNSTITGNRARNPGYTRGGGVANAAEMLIVNSTITANSAQSINNAAPGIEGGGLLAVDGKVTLRGVTIAGNESRRLTLPGYGANVAVMAGAELVATSTIVSDPVTADNCRVSPGSVASGGFNLSDGGACGFTASTDLVGSPGLAVLADNGGPVDTMLPAAGGPAIDAGSSGGESFDARGLARVVDQGEFPNAGDGADIGAVELPDVTAPETVIAEAPKKLKAKRGKKAKARYTLTSNDATARFECSVDGKAFKPCAESLRLKLKKGRHTLEARATDAAGNVDQTPAKAKTKVKAKRK